MKTKVAQPKTQSWAITYLAQLNPIVTPIEEKGE